MSIIGSKAEVKIILSKTFRHLENDEDLVKAIHYNILKQKMRFPLLEFATTELYNFLPANKQIPITDKIFELRKIGSYVFAGIMLQHRLPKYFEQSISKAVEYITVGADWLICDTIAERVLGYALLTTPEKTLPHLKQLAKEDDKWIVRSVGVAGHYAIKKGLKKRFVDELFQLLMTLNNTTDFHTKKGVGWAAKTTAKFHPEIIEKYSHEIETDPRIKQWFKTKIKIGLGRTFKYAHRYTG